MWFPPGGAAAAGQAPENAKEAPPKPPSEPEAAPRAAQAFESLVAELRKQYPGRSEVARNAELLRDKLLQFAREHDGTPAAAAARNLAAEILEASGDLEGARALWRQVAFDPASGPEGARALSLLAISLLMGNGKEPPRTVERNQREAKRLLEKLLSEYPECPWRETGRRLLRYLSLRTSRDAPSFSGRFEKDGETVEIKSEALRGKVVLLDFWRSDTPGQAEFERTLRDDLQRVLKEYPDLEGKVIVLGVNLDRDRSRFERARREWGIPWLQLHDGKGFSTPVADVFGIVRVPHLAVIDPEGRLLYLGDDRQAFFRAATRALKALRAAGAGAGGSR